MISIVIYNSASHMVSLCSQKANTTIISDETIAEIKLITSTTAFPKFLEVDTQ